MRVPLIVLTAVWVMFPAPAQAYLDPGTGSMILQGIVAAIAGIFVTGKLYWTRIKSFFSRENPEERKKDKSGSED